MVSLPFELQLLHTTDCPASFTGHPIIQQLIEQHYLSKGSNSNYQRQLQQGQQGQLGRQQQQEEEQEVGKGGGGVIGSVDSRAMLPWFADGQFVKSMFLKGDGVGFRAQHAERLWPQLVCKEGGIAEAATTTTTTSSSSSNGSSSSNSRSNRSSSSSGNGTEEKEAAGGSGGGLSPATAPLLLLLPGQHERELKECIPAFGEWPG